MIPARVYLAGAPANAGILESLAQALDALGVPVETGAPPPLAFPAAPDVAPSAVVLVLSKAALALPDFGARLDAYETLVAENPATVVIPVARELLPADSLPLWLRQYEPVIAIGDAPDTRDVIKRGVLRRLGLDHANEANAVVIVGDTSGAAAPLLVAESPDTSSDTSSADTVRLPVLASAAEPSNTTSPDTNAPDATSPDTIPLTVPPPSVAALDTVPIPAVASFSSDQPSGGAHVVAPSESWRRRLERQRRPIALGVLASLILLLLACVVFSLGVGSPGGQGADRLNSGLPGADVTFAPATTSTTASASPSVSATTPKATQAAARRTPTAGVPTSTLAPPTATPVPPTPTPPIPGLHGDYFHSTKYRPGTPVPYPDPIFGVAWFSQTDTIIDMGYGQQSHTYSPAEAAFDSRVCPSPPTSSPCSPFAVRWTGFVLPQYSEAYTFTTDSDDGVKLWINGQLVIDDWQIQGDTPEQSAPINLTANQLVPIQIEYYENGEGPATMVLQWQSASQPLEVIPPSVFYLPG